MAGYNHLYVKELYLKYKGEHKNTTDAEIANEMDISREALKKIISGAYIPGVPALYKIALFFGKTMNYFIDETHNESSNIIHEPIPEYNTKNSETEGWKAAAEALKENVELQKELSKERIENERLKKLSAPANTASAG